MSLSLATHHHVRDLVRLGVELIVGVTLDLEDDLGDGFEAVGTVPGCVRIYRGPLHSGGVGAVP